MRKLPLILVGLAIPAIAAAQAVVTGAGTTAAKSGPTMSSRPDMESGAIGTSVQRAQEILNAVRQVCTLLENDGKLFAACDNTTPAAKMRGSMSYLPQLITEWEIFAKRVQEADKVANGKTRPLVVLNGSTRVAEVSSGGTVKLIK